ncbi:MULTISPECIES: MBL fold metallo-hydrolase [unclassified Cryobacterium]|uniref:MBL fold metallo-hydrolase n=1 Tax=unclassified Cryobacterium TaxID=2649013 RepID=UPI00106C046A|nr:MULTISPECIES: MBL fold metallo-hydrolase [unclassified Cryobacterium]TFC54727.1 MBL fold metallo-hydrolase [Cryobacterium sp. TMB3-1-2]TFC71500.1 MBL fold metallo-hydrolase [Cryobacterium sp. TMB3-15]TFC72311.1 MBL fold metallo-hydrolase [Cryobacterium sp. TMB3-10]TFD42487.1 MBL fold metallo-hydrolase [Cryobacterium sp. TMB3-12]
MRLGPHLHRIGNDIVAAYLVDTPEGVTVIDAGLAGQWRDLLAELTGMRRTLSDVKGVILTHGDGDHVGFAERLRRDHGVPVYVHPGDAARAKGGPKPANGPQSMKLGATLGFAAYSLRKGGMRTTYLTETVDANDGDTLNLPGAPRIIGLPGHSEGSIAIHVPIADAVFVGDGLTTRHVLTGKTGPQPAPFTDEPEQAIASLRAILPTGATWVLPGHGTPWNAGVAAAVTAVEKAARV